MSLNLLSNGLIWAVVAVLVIGRQFLPRSIKPSMMVLMPAAIGVLGAYALVGSPPAGVAAVALLGINLALSAAMGLLRGLTVRVWEGDGAWMMQGTVLTLVCWAASIVLKVGVGFAGHAAFSENELALLLAVTLGAQNVVVGARVAGLLPTGAPVRSR